MEGIVFNIKKFAIHDGPGIRTTVFLKGCPLNCLWCHNPESVGNACLNESSKNEKSYSLDELMNEIEKDLIFYDESGGGVTFSGGEPFVQHTFLKDILEKCKKHEIHTAIDTTGYTSTDIFSDFIHLPNLFLYDFKLFDNGKHKEFTGVENTIIKKHLMLLSKFDKKCKLRIPLVSNITDTDENIYGILNFIKGMSNITEINLLPFHRGGEGKLKSLNKKVNESLKTPKDERINKILNIFIDNHFIAKIGG